jgi:mono/diheme cytochrome c family protein
MHCSASIVTASVVLAAAFALACTSNSVNGPTATPNDASTDAGADQDVGSPAYDITAVPGSDQRTGDPDAGYRALVDNGYVGCGVPYTAYSKVFSAAPAWQQLPGRAPVDDGLPYNLTRFTTTAGVDVVGPNCLTCHAAPLFGKVVVGLGDTTTDYTYDQSGAISAASIFLTDPKEIAELNKFANRTGALGPYTLTSVVGVNPADNVAAVLFAHRDRKTLAWSDTPLLDLPPKIVVPVDVPPWWRMSKKNAMFYLAAGRGDHARIMMTASTLCIDTVDDARAIDAYFGDVEAFITKIAPPKYPFAVDATLATRGKSLFDGACATCHGSYGDAPTYPNVVASLEEVGTDPVLGTATEFADADIQWFNQSFYGETAQLAPMKAYYAPPLDGIWATAPYLHNGSVPSLATLLDSSKRPQFWKRNSTDSNDFDSTEIGWKYAPSAVGHKDIADPSARKLVYDTTELGYSNAGHVYSDGMSDDDRNALLEYLKTL